MWYGRYLRLCPLAAAALLVMAPVEVSFARLYKWVDEYGNVTYSERKPPGQAAEEIKVRTAPATSSPSEEQSDGVDDENDEQPNDGSGDQAVAKDRRNEEELFKTNCQIARQNRKVLQHSARVRGTNAQGESYFLDEKEILARLEQANRQIELYCR